MVWLGLEPKHGDARAQALNYSAVMLSQVCIFKSHKINCKQAVFLTVDCKKQITMRERVAREGNVSELSSVKNIQETETTIELSNLEMGYRVMECLRGPENKEAAQRQQT